MRLLFMGSIAAVALAGAGIGRAGDLGINVILSGNVAPGVYGQVQIGNASPPPVVYAQPMLIEQQAAPPPPVYLHVPPGHAKNWRKHCREYNACNRPVYFVRSAEYEPDYARNHGHDRDEHRHDDDHGRGHDHDHDRDHDHDHDRHDDH
jgi:hypothetical protein